MPFTLFDSPCISSSALSFFFFPASFHPCKRFSLLLRFLSFFLSFFSFSLANEREGDRVRKSSSGTAIWKTRSGRPWRWQSVLHAREGRCVLSLFQWFDSSSSLSLSLSLISLPSSSYYTTSSLIRFFFYYAIFRLLLLLLHSVSIVFLFLVAILYDIMVPFFFFLTA